MCKVTRVATKAFVLSLFAFGWIAVLLVTAHAENLYGADQGLRQVVMENLNRLPLLFTENQGQLHGDVGFYVHGWDKTLYFTPQGVTFALTGKMNQNETIRRWVIKLDFVGANSTVRPRGESRQKAVISYFKGKPEDWKTGLPTYGKVVYPNLWPGIDLVYSGSVNKLKYEFVVKPDADPNQIRLVYRGATDVFVKETGQLAVTIPFGGLEDAAPYAYQDIDGQRVEVPMAYTLNGKTSGDVFEYGFNVGAYDPTRPLILDPVVLAYCGYIGGDWGDDGWNVAVDAFGNAYVVGETNSPEATFPVIIGPDTTYNGHVEAFVAKVKTDGTGFVYCGYIGGENADIGYGIAVDGEGYAYVTGRTESSEATFPVKVGPDLTHNDDVDVFVAKVAADGTDLVYCGYIGGTAWEEGWDIAVDVSGSAYVTGWVMSSQASFPVAVGPDLTHNGGQDAFVAKVRADGTGLVYCGYIGGIDIDEGRGITVDANYNAYATGRTRSTQASFPEVTGPDLTHNGESDAWVAKVDVDGNSLIYCGYIGGEYWDLGWGVAVDFHGNAYVTGRTDSPETSFPVLVGPDLTYNGLEDVFVTKVNPDGTGLIYSGYIGGEGGDYAYSVAVDKCGNAYVAGNTSSTEATFPVVDGPDLTYNGGDTDAFVAKVKADGTALHYCGYIGGEDREFGNGIAVDVFGNAYVAGTVVSTETSFPVLVGPDLTHNGGYWDGFVAKIGTDFLPPVGYWRFDEGTGSITYDETANHNDGTITGASWTTGVSGNGLYFHGGGQFFDGDGVTVPHSPSLDISGEFTIEAFIKAKGSDSYLAIVDKYRHQVDAEYGFTLYLTDGTIRLTVYSGANGQRTVLGTSDLRDDTWHHVAGTWDGSYIRVYVDCQMENEATWDCPPASTTNNLGIGKRLSGYGGYMPFLGVIDEVRISSGAKCGDVNDDEVIDLGDVLYLISYLYKSGLAPDPLWTGDVTCDGIIELGDVLHLISYLYKGGSPPCG